MIDKIKDEKFAHPADARDALTEAWQLLNVLCLNMMDDGPAWPRVLEWLRKNEQFRPKSNQP